MIKVGQLNRYLYDPDLRVLCEYQVKGKDWLNRKNRSKSSEEKDKFDLSPETVSSWNKKEQSEIHNAKGKSLQFLIKADDYSNPAKKVTQRWKVLPTWRKTVIDEMLKDPNSEIYQRVCPPASFPKDTKGESKFENLKLSQIHDIQAIYTGQEHGIVLWIPLMAMLVM